nr:MAG TPA: hypothetical protein [Caudoviricetes sp.]
MHLRSSPFNCYSSLKMTSCKNTSSGNIHFFL